MLRAKPSYCRVLRFGSPALILHGFRIRLRSSCGYRLLVRSRLRGVFMARAVVPHLASRFAGFVFTIALLSDCGHRLRVPMMCDDSAVVASVSLQDGTMSRFPLLVDSRLFLVLFECLDLHLPRILCQGSSSVLAGFSSTVGIRLWGQSGFFPSQVDATLLCAWVFPLFDCSQRVSPSCFPFFVPSS